MDHGGSAEAGGRRNKSVLCATPKTRLDYPKLEEESNRSMSAFGSVPTF